MLVSVVIPACDAAPTIGRAVASVLAQDYPSWEAIIVADDRQDYAATLARLGITDQRLRFASTGRIRSGCHNARNAGLAAAAGEIVAQLDADDLYDPRRLARLVPLAAMHGAAVDDVAVVSETSGGLLRTALGRPPPARLSADTLLELGTPLFPVVRRDLAERRLTGIEYAEDVIANLRLIERLGPLPVLACPLYEYRVVPGSLCHDAASGAAFDRAYGDYLARLRRGDAFGLVRTRAAALSGFIRKRAVNRRFMAAQARRPDLTFQEYMARRRAPAHRLSGRH